MVHSDFEGGKLGEVVDILEEMIAQLHHLVGVDGDASQVEMGCVGLVASWLPGWQPDGLVGWLGGWLASWLAAGWFGGWLVSGLLAGTQSKPGDASRRGFVKNKLWPHMYSSCNPNLCLNIFDTNGPKIAPSAKPQGGNSLMSAPLTSGLR